MSTRKTIERSTVEAVAAEFAGQPLDPERAEAYLDFAEPIYQMFEGLRGLPLKDVEPAVIFRPVERDES